MNRLIILLIVLVCFACKDKPKPIGPRHAISGIVLDSFIRMKTGLRDRWTDDSAMLHGINEGGEDGVIDSAYNAAISGDVIRDTIYLESHGQPNLNFNLSPAASDTTTNPKILIWHWDYVLDTIGRLVRGKTGKWVSDSAYKIWQQGEAPSEAVRWYIHRRDSAMRRNGLIPPDDTVFKGYRKSWDSLKDNFRKQSLQILGDSTEIPPHRWPHTIFDKEMEDGTTRGRPMTAIEAAAFHKELRILRIEDSIAKHKN
jgi:hypothetical protein